MSTEREGVGGRQAPEESGPAAGQEEGKEPSPEELEAEVMQMVRKQLRRDPPPPLAALYGRAVRIDPRIRKLDLRQFNARFPLRVRRERKAAKRRAKAAERRRERKTERPRQISPETRSRVRDIVLQYGKAVLSAETDAALVDVLVEADLYADAIIQAAVGERSPT